MSTEHGATDERQDRAQAETDRRSERRSTEARVWSGSERRFRELLQRFGGRQTDTPRDAATQAETDRHSAERQPSALARPDERTHREGESPC